MTSIRPVVAVWCAAVLLSTSCGSDTASDTTTTSAEPTSSASIDPTSSTSSPPGSATTQTTEGPATTGGSALVPEDELEAAAGQVEAFVDALGAGDVDRAATLVGPVSEGRAGGADGLMSLLRESTEGHGAWASADGRTVTPVAIEAGLVAVMLQGTLQVEGTTEHRVEVFPVRRDRSADTWLVEPWAYDLSAGRPIEITGPAVDVEERATIDPTTPLEVTVQVDSGGTVAVSFDAMAPRTAEATGADTVTMTAAAAGTSSVVVVHSSGPDVAALGFVADGAGGDG